MAVAIVTKPEVDMLQQLTDCVLRSTRFFVMEGDVKVRRESVLCAENMGFSKKWAVHKNAF